MRATALAALLAVTLMAGLVGNRPLANGRAARSSQSTPASALVASRAPVNGEAVGADPDVSQGQLIAFTVDGFAPGATATLTLECQPLAAIPLRANARGVVRVSFTVPSLPPAGYLLSVAGPSARVSGGSSTGVVEVSIPRAAFYPFEVTMRSNGHSSAGHAIGPPVHGRCTSAVLK